MDVSKSENGTINVRRIIYSIKWVI
jgi:hypothetical protein